MNMLNNNNSKQIKPQVNIPKPLNNHTQKYIANTTTSDPTNNNNNNINSTNNLSTYLSINNKQNQSISFPNTPNTHSFTLTPDLTITNTSQNQSIPPQNTTTTYHSNTFNPTEDVDLNQIPSNNSNKSKLNNNINGQNNHWHNNQNSINNTSLHSSSSLYSSIPLHKSLISNKGHVGPTKPPKKNNNYKIKSNENRNNSFK